MERPPSWSVEAASNVFSLVLQSMWLLSKGVSPPPPRTWRGGGDLQPLLTFRAKKIFAASLGGPLGGGGTTKKENKKRKEKKRKERKEKKKGGKKTGRTTLPESVGIFFETALWTQVSGANPLYGRQNVLHRFVSRVT